MPDERRTRFNRGQFLEKYQAKRRGFIPVALWNALMADIANGIATALITSFAGGQVDASTAGTALAVNLPGAGSAPLHPLSVVDASAGATPMIQVTPGYVTDLGSNIAYMPTIDGNPINVKIGSDYPTLTVAPEDKVIWLETVIDHATGRFSSAPEVKKGAIPTASSIDLWVIVLTDIMVTLSGSGLASVSSLDDNVQGAISLFVCGPVPLVEGYYSYVS